MTTRDNRTDCSSYNSFQENPNHKSKIIDDDVPNDIAHIELLVSDFHQQIVCMPEK
jgi:hypothetical protein